MITYNIFFRKPQFNVETLFIKVSYKKRDFSFLGCIPLINLLVVNCSEVILEKNKENQQLQ